MTISIFVPNKLDRYTLSARNSLNKNADGSVDLYLQANSPGAGEEIELASNNAKRQVHPDDAALLAEGNAALDS